MGSSSKNNKKPQGRGASPLQGAAPGAINAPQLVGQQMDMNAPAIMGAPTGPQPDPSRGLGPVDMGGGNPDAMRQMIAQMMQRDEMLKRSQMMDTSGRGARGMGGAFGNGFGGGRGGNTPGGGYGGGKRGSGLY